METDTQRWRETTFMLVVPYALGWATHSIPERPVFSRGVLEDRAELATLRRRWEAECDRHSDADGQVRDWGPLNAFREANPVPPGAPHVMMWDPAVLGVESGTTEHNHWYEPHKYFHSGRTRRAARPARFACWPGHAIARGAPLFADLPELELLATERWEFGADPGSTTQEMGYAVLHLRLGGCDGATLQRASELLRRPKGSREVDQVLRRMGLAVRLKTGAFSELDEGHVRYLASNPRHTPVDRYSTVYAPGRRWVGFGGRPFPTAPTSVDVTVLDGETELMTNARSDVAQAVRDAPVVTRTVNRTRVLTVATPTQPLTEPPSNLAPLTAWSAEEAWTHQLATGMNREKYFRLPANTGEAAAHGCFRVDGSAGRASWDGVGVLIDPVLLNPQDERDVASLRALYHGRLLEVTLLAIRQRDWLDAHNEAVAGVETNPDEHQPGDEPVEVVMRGSQWPKDESVTPRAKLERIMAIERNLNWFHNNKWFTEVPGRPEATTLLRELQAAYETPELLRESRGELKDLVGSAELHKQLADLDQQEAAVRSRDRLEQLLALVAGIGLLLALAALVADPSWLLAVASLAVAAVLGLVIVGFSRRTTRRRRERRREPRRE